MGKSSTNIPWGVTFNDKWQSSLPKLLSEVRQSTPHIDLALFAIRDIPIRQESEEIYPVIIESLRSKFTVELCEYFTSKFEKEKIFASHLKCVFSDHYKTFAALYEEEFTTEFNYKQLKKDELIERIIFLEGILKNNNISIKDSR